MYVRFWGTRGSIPAPGPETNHFGGNTSCVEVRTDDGTRIILDCGTGARRLGRHLMETARQTSEKLRLHLFFGHTHWDHIQGFPFFEPAFIPDSDLNIYATAGFQKGLEESLSGQMQYSYFPVKMRELLSHIHYTELEEGFFRVGDILIETQHLNHTAPTIAYRITCDGATLAYSTDHEPFWQPDGLNFHHPGDQRHIAFLQGADLVIHDAQYLEREYPSRFGWGHSTVEYATDVAVAAGVGRLALFHHDPSRADQEVVDLEVLARRRAEGHKSSLEISAAYEGLTIELRGKGREPEVTELSALRHRPISGKRVLVVSGSEVELGKIAAELEEDNLVLLRASSAATAAASVAAMAPDMIIVDSAIHDMDSLDLVSRVRNGTNQSRLPILVFNDDRSAEVPLRHFDAGATDYLAKPFSPPMLRSRVRAWLARASTELEVGYLASSPAPRVASSPPTTIESVEGNRLPLAVESIASIPVFQSLSAAQIELLTAKAVERYYQGGQTIIHQGDAAAHLYILLAGRVRLFSVGDGTSTGEAALGELGPGQVFGELGILINQSRSASVVAVEPSLCLELPAAAFTEVLQESPDLGVILLRILADRIYDADRRLARYAPDPLTGLPGRRSFNDQYLRLVARTRRRGGAILLVLLDVLNLKKINDRYGYSVGDEVVQAVSIALSESARRADLAARLGSDEFALLLVDSETAATETILDRLQSRLQQTAAAHGITIPFECAVGVAAAEVPPDGADELFVAADLDMQRRKAEGKPGLRVGF